jgi:phosphatidylinositol glycan class O
MFVIDAFRFDFAFKQESMPFLNSLLKNNNSQTLFYKFVADAPTTTSQRLKALTTGSLPTFIDAGKNFDSDAVTEDNWIYQLVNHNKKIVGLGDDTWIHLYPQQQSIPFTRARFFPSFDVWDLHTLDNGILRYLHSELNTEGTELQSIYDKYRDIDSTDENYPVNFEKWDLLIAHFLGVDHAGHRYGVHHQEMHNKLLQMDNLLKDIISDLPDDTLLLMFGDHGMNDNGDHGGSTDLEVDSALFVYSKSADINRMKQFNSILDSNEGYRKQEEISDILYRTISQIDLVPTLSFLTNTPIPYGNLGMVIPEILQLVSGKYNALDTIVQSIRINSHQTWRYLTTYSSIDSTLLSVDQIRNLKELLKSADELYNNEYTKQSRDDNEVLVKVYEQYTKFMIATNRLCRERWANFSVTRMVTGLVVSACSILVSLLLLLIVGINNNSTMNGFSIFVAVEFIVYCIVKLSITMRLIPDYIYESTIAVASIQYLDYVQAVIILILLVLYCLLCYSTRCGNTKSFNSITSLQKVQTYLSIFSFVLYLGSLFSNSFIVYEDRIIIFQLLSHGLLFALYRSNNFNWKRVSGLLVSIIYILCIRFSGYRLRLRLHGTHHVESPPVEPFDLTKICFHLFIILLISSYCYINNIRVKWRRYLAIAYTSICLSLICGYWYMNFNRSQQDFVTSAINWHLWLPRSVYFLWIVATCIVVLSSMDNKYQILFLICCTPLLLLKGHTYCFIHLLMIEQTICFSHMNNDDRALWLKVSHWVFFGMQYFFALGQQNTLNTIQWTSAFVGIDNAQMFWSGVLVTVNTFGPKILYTITLPMIVTKRSNLKRAFIMYSVIYGFISLISMICAAIQRRHLMVWAIFAHKFIFDSMSTVIVNVLVITCLLLCN